MASKREYVKEWIERRRRLLGGDVAEHDQRRIRGAKADAFFVDDVSSSTPPPLTKSEKRKPVEELGMLASLANAAGMSQEVVERSVYLAPALAGRISDPVFWDVLLGSLRPYYRTLGAADALRFGAKKREWEGWRKAPVRDYQNAALRHYFAPVYYQRSPVLDAESGLAHDAHAAADFAIVAEILRRGEVNSPFLAELPGKWVE